jgi:single-strand DNA-binding protein
MNLVSLIGRLGGDPEVRYTPQGTPVANMSLAVNERWNGNERTYWFRVITWNRLAEIVAEHLSKGNKVGISGRLTSRQWEDREGNSRTVVEVVADKVDFLDPRKTEAVETTGEAPQDEQPESLPDDDIPF